MIFGSIVYVEESFAGNGDNRSLIDLHGFTRPAKNDFSNSTIALYLKVKADVDIHIVLAAVGTGRERVKRYLEILADNLSRAGWSWSCVSGADSREQSSLLMLIAAESILLCARMKSWPRLWNLKQWFASFETMNTPQKILTVLAIVVFAFMAIVLPWNDPDQSQWGKWEPEMTLITSGSGLALSPFGDSNC
jgi:hypothetical protein